MQFGENAVMWIFRFILYGVPLAMLYGSWVLSELIMPADYQDYGFGFERIFVWLFLFAGLVAAFGLLVFLTVELPRSIRRARFWRSKHNKNIQ